MSRQTIATLMNGVVALSRDLAAPMLGLSMPADLSVAGDAARSGTDERFTVQRGIAIVPVRGLLTPNMTLFERYFGWATYQGLADTLAVLAASDEVAGIALDFDSPGGMVLGIEEAANAIAAAVTAKPVHALVNPLAASAAYWLASQCTDIAMTPGALVGSIGAMVLSSAPVQAGVRGDQYFEFRSSHARSKNADPSTETGAALIQQRLDRSEAHFHAAVASGRGIALDALPAQLSVTDDVRDGGDVFQFAEAQERGLADAEMTRNAFFVSMLERYAPPPASGQNALSVSASNAAKTAAAAMARAAC